MTDPLVSTMWLAERLGDESLVILDASWHMPAAERDAADEYARGHIPRAVFFDIDRTSDHDSPLPHMMPSPSDFAISTRRLGVSASSIVIVYDRLGLFSAARAWWMFRAFGHEAVFVLDGGAPRWMSEGRPMETGWREPAHGDFKSRPRPDLVRSLQQVTTDLRDPLHQVLDARPAPRFLGEAPEPRPGLRTGHMPGAKNLPFTRLIDGDALAAEARLRAIFEAAGADPAKSTVATCGSGVSAAVIALALARLGQSDAAIYDGSWAEWGARDDTAVAIGP